MSARVAAGDPHHAQLSRGVQHCNTTRQTLPFVTHPQTGGASDGLSNLPARWPNFATKKECAQMGLARWRRVVLLRKMQVGEESESETYAEPGGVG
jgi:hypothetical protein